MAGRHQCCDSLNVKPPRIALPRAEPCLIASLRNVERQIEADDRGAKIVGAIEQHFVDELGDCPQRQSIVAREALE